MKTKTAQRMKRLQTTFRRIERIAAREIASLDRLVQIEPEHFRASIKLDEIRQRAAYAADLVGTDTQTAIEFSKTA